MLAHFKSCIDFLPMDSCKQDNQINDKLGQSGCKSVFYKRLINLTMLRAFFSCFFSLYFVLIYMCVCFVFFLLKPTEYTKVDLLSFHFFRSCWCIHATTQAVSNLQLFYIVFTAY